MSSAPKCFCEFNSFRYQTGRNVCSFGLINVDAGGVGVEVDLGCPDDGAQPESAKDLVDFTRVSRC